MDLRRRTTRERNQPQKADSADFKVEPVLPLEFSYSAAIRESS